MAAVRAASSSCFRATMSPACQPGVRPPAGGWSGSVPTPLRASTQAITRVRIPHFTRRKLTATPDGSRDLRDQVEYSPRTCVVGHSQGAVYGLGDVRDMSTAPKTDFIAEDLKPARPATADSASGDDAPLLAAQVCDRSLLDHERSLSDFNLERRVVEITCRTPLHPGRQRLVDPTVDRHKLPARA
jgi:hypothetical protein